MGVSVIIASEWRWVKTICFGSFWVKQQSKEDKTSQQTVRIEDARKVKNEGQSYWKMNEIDLNDRALHCSKTAPNEPNCCDKLIK